MFQVNRNFLFVSRFRTCCKSTVIFTTIKTAVVGEILLVARMFELFVEWSSICSYFTITILLLSLKEDADSNLITIVIYQANEVSRLLCG